MNSNATTQGKKRIICGQPSWRLTSTDVEAFVTEMGGHLGPVTFDRKGRKLQPYSIAPWAEEQTDPSLPPIIKALRERSMDSADAPGAAVGEDEGAAG